MDRKKKILIGTGVVLVLAVGALYYLAGRGGAAGAGTGGMGGPGGQAGQGGMAQATSVTSVKAAVPATGDVSVSTSLTGTVEAADVVYVYAKAGGDVTEVKVKAGDVVTQGQVLCEINTEQVETARNSMESARVSLAEAQNNLSRMQILHDSGNLSEQDYEQYTTKVESARLQYESAQLAYNKQVEYSTVTAPIAGRIESCDVDVYDRVSQSAQLCVIAGEGGSRITFYVSQRMLNNLNEGDQLEVVKNGKAYSGYISELSSMVDPDSGLFKVKAEMENTDEIAIGSTVKLNVVTARARDAMLVPVNAVYYSGGDAYVYLYEDGEARMVPVEVGLYDSDYAQILSGLTPDQLVVGTWSSNLYEGAKIRLIEETGEAQGQDQDQAQDQDQVQGQNREED